MLRVKTAVKTALNPARSGLLPARRCMRNSFEAVCRCSAIALHLGVGPEQKRSASLCHPLI
nr:MAG TPA: hypothetical protein [Caudoviricetes sp.]